MDFRDLMNTLDSIEKPVLSEALTLSAILALTAGYEQDDKVRIPKLGDLAQENGLEGLVDPITGHYVDNEGEEYDEVPFEMAEKLSAAGLLPKNARLPQAGWFDNNRVFNAANKNLQDQSSTIAAHHDLVSEKLHQIRQLIKRYVELRDKRATSKMQSEIGEKPILPSNAPSSLAAKMTPTFPSQTMAGLKESAGLANAIMESMELFEDLKDQEWSFKRPPVTPKPTEVSYMKHPELTQSANAALKHQMPAMGSNSEYNAGNVQPTVKSTAPSADAPISNKAAKKAAKSVSMDMDALAKSASAGEKAAAKGLLSKTASRLVPGIATAYSAADAYDRYKKGDYTGAGIAGAAGLASLVPGIGTGLGLTLDAVNAGRDYMAPGGEVLPNKQAEPTDTDTPPETSAPPAANKQVPVTPTAPTGQKTTKPVSPTRQSGSAPPHHRAARAISANEFQQYLKSLGATNSSDITTSVNTYILGNNK